jgi:DNA-binding CsgD family transcriptional regulator
MPFCYRGFRVVIKVKIHAGLTELANALEQGLAAFGFELTHTSPIHLLVDAPWGWAVSPHATVTVADSIVVSDNPCPEYQLDLLERSPKALLTQASVAEIAAALRHLAKAGRMPTPKFASPLTKAERLTLRLAAKGHDNKTIAKVRHVSEGTVKNTIQSIFQKLGFHARVQLALYYYGCWHVLEDWQPPYHT